MNNTILSAAERKQYADRIRPIAADYDEYEFTSVRLQVRRRSDGKAVRDCVLIFDNGETTPVGGGGRPSDDTTDEIILDKTYPSLVALTEEQPHVAEMICNDIEGWFN